MSLNPSSFHVPEHADEVVALLEEHGEEALILAGGTFVHGLDARGLLAGVTALIDIQKLDLGGVEVNGGLRAGATTRFRRLAAEPGLHDEPRFGAVADALAHLPLQVANAATLGGAVATACPFFDLPVTLMALDATVTARGPAGTRTIPLAGLFADLFRNSLAPAEFVAEVRLPAAPPGSASGFAKLATNANDLAVVNAAVAITVDGDGTCTGARVVVGGGGLSAPVRSASAEAALRGTALAADAVEAAGAAASADVEPFSDHRASGAYRKAMAGVLVKRALGRALGRMGEGGAA